MSRSLKPSHYRTNDFILQEDFSSLTGWTLGGDATGKSATVDTAHVQHGTASIKLHMDAAAAIGQTVQIEKSGSWDFSRGMTHGIKYFGGDNLVYADVAIVLSNDAGFTNTATLSLQGVYDWVAQTAKKASYTLAGSFNWNLPVVGIRLIVTITTDGFSQDIWLDALASGANARTKILINFDDGYDSIYTEAFLNYMKPLGMVGTVFIPGNNIGTAGFMTVAQLKELQDNGWCIASHGWDVNTSLAVSGGRTTAQGTADLIQALSWMTTNGLISGIAHMAWPFGQFDDAIIAAAQSLGIVSARAFSSTVTNSRIYTGLQLENKMKLPVASELRLVVSGTTPTSVRTDVRSTQTFGATHVITGHALVAAATGGTYEWTVANFSTLVGYLELIKDQGGADIVAWHDWYSGLRS